MADEMKRWNPSVDADEQQVDDSIDREVLERLLQNPTFQNFVENLPEPDDPSQNWSDDEDLDEDEMDADELSHHKAFYPSEDEEIDEAMALRIKRALNKKRNEL